MTTFEGRQNSSINKVPIEEIKDYDNSALRTMLEGAGVAEQGYVISPEDFEAIRTRAIYIAGHINVPASPEALLMTAFVDRMRTVERIGDEMIKNMPDNALRSIIYVDTGHEPTDEELLQLRATPLSFHDWEQGRVMAQQNIKGFDVAVDQKGSVVGMGESSEEAARRAQKETGAR